MSATRLAQTICAGIGLALTVNASGQPPGHTQLMAGPPPEVRPMSPRAIAYLAGKQALVGSHASSEAPAPRDAQGRPMLSLRSINRGDSLTIGANAEGSFASGHLDRAPP